MEFDIIIVGGGAAGLMAACHAPRGARVAVLERLESPGRKILATGGGRCNFTTALDASELPALFGRQGRFIANAVRAFPPERIREWFAREGVDSVVEEGRFVFPASHRAADILEALRRAAQKRGATIMTDTSAESLAIAACGGADAPSRAVEGVRVVGRGARPGGAADAGCLIRARKVILAAGGHSMPSLGSNGSGFALARQAGHAVVDPVPALVPLVAADEWAKSIPGVSLDDALVRFDPRKFGANKRMAAREERGAVMFTHHGVSGPAVLDISGAVSEALANGAPATLALRPVADMDSEAWRATFAEWRAKNGGKALRNLLPAKLPRAFAQALCTLAGVPDAPLAQTGGDALRRLAELCGWLPLVIAGTEGWDRSMATRGGVSLSEVHPATLGSRLVRGLHFAGEILDLDAPCGGFNLTWAFASGALAMSSALG